MPVTKKRAFKEIENESNSNNAPEPPRKRKKESNTATNESNSNNAPKSPRKRRKRSKRKPKKKQIKIPNMIDLKITEFETIAIIAPDTDKISGSSKIAAFDMDWTLIKTKGKTKFPTDRKDWVWLYPNVPSKLKQLAQAGYQVVIFSNQNGIGTGKQTLESVAGKIIDLSQEVNCCILLSLLL